MESHNVFARNDNTLFFTADNEPAEGLSLPNEYAPHEMSRYRKNDFIGSLTGQSQSNKKGKVTRLEVEIPYFHWIMEEISFFGTRSLPRRIKSSVRLWVNIEDVKSESTLPRFSTNRFTKAMTMLRIAGETLLANSPRFSWLATRLHIVRY
jgi:hypothetical protein